MILRLSDAFIEEKDEYALELVVKLININYGIPESNEILTKDSTLRGYSQFVYYVRKYQDEGMLLEQAIRQAIAYCIEKDILRDFLKEHEKEVANMFTAECSMDDVLAVVREEGWQDGRQDGRQEEKLLTAKNLLAEGYDTSKIIKVTGLKADEIEKLL